MSNDKNKHESVPAIITYHEKRGTLVAYCYDHTCTAELCSWEEAQGWLYLNDDATEDEYETTVTCRACGLRHTLPAEQQAEKMLDRHPRA